MRRSVWLLACLLAACTMSPAAPSSTPSPERTSEATRTPVAARGTGSAGEPAPIESVLPTTLGGVELHTFEVGPDILDRLLPELGVTADEFETAYASEHGARFFQMYAVRLAGTPAATLATAWEAAAYPPDVEDVVVSDQTIGGRRVTVVHAPSAAARLGTFYVLAQDETLFVVQAMDPEVAAEAIAALP